MNYNHRIYKTLVTSLILLLVSAAAVLAQDTQDPTMITAIEWSPDNSLIAFGRVDGSVEIVDAVTQTTQQTLIGHTDIVMDISWSADSTRLATSSIDTTINLWDTADGELINTLEGHMDWVTAVLWSPDGELVYSGSVADEQTLKVWDVQTGKPITGTQIGTVIELMFNPDQTLLTAVIPAGHITLLDPQTLEPTGIETFQYPEKDLTTEVAAWSADGKWIAAGGIDGSIAIWDAATGDVATFIESAFTEADVDYFKTAIRELSFTADNQLLSLQSDGTVTLWDISTGEQLATEALAVTVRRATWQHNNINLAISEHLTIKDEGSIPTTRNSVDQAQLQLFSVFTELDLFPVNAE